jgi:hypothetical protein
MASLSTATGDKMEAEMIVIEWDIPSWLQAEMDWWEANPTATEAEFEDWINVCCWNND